MINDKLNTFTFALVLDGFHEPSPKIEDALYEAGCDDGILTFRGRTPVIEFDRQADCIELAISSAINDVEKADISAIVLRVEPDDLVNASEIARRTKKTREAIRLWIEGERGSGDFPPPMAILEQSILWSWQEVAAWLVQHELLNENQLKIARAISYFNVFLENQRAGSSKKEIERINKLLQNNSMMVSLRKLRVSFIK